MFGFSFSATKARDWRDLQTADWKLYEEIVLDMVDNGVMPEPDGLEPWFLCSDHTEGDAAETLQKFEDAVRRATGKS
jgi:glutamate-1-semialdehyde aminotransferase